MSVSNSLPSSESRNSQTWKVALRGEALLDSPRWNKGTAFSAKERERFGLTGRLPYTINSIDDQCARAYDQLKNHESDLRKNAFLQSLRSQNWVLYYALLDRHLKELMPIIYTPTEADAISQYSHLFRRSEGLYLSFLNQDTMEEDFLEQIRDRNIDLIVCSDGEAILGIGDQGVGGIGISTAKAAVYTLIGAIDPSKTLPVTLDVGTNNEDLLGDPLYVGWREKRVRGEAYDKFIDKFVQLVRKHKPHCLLHFEDFGVSNAQAILERYRDQHAVFNDDVQGTGAVTLAALSAAIGVTGTSLSDQRIVIFGAGSAGLGIARQLRDAMLAEGDSGPNNGRKLSREEASKRFWLVDRYGLVDEALADKGKVRQGTEEFVRSGSNWASSDGGDAKALNDVQLNEHGSVALLDVVKHVHPTVLIGTSTSPGAFCEEVIRAMSKNVERPIIFPLSNPSRLVEVHPHKAFEWSDGKALLATGSPFESVKTDKGEYVIAECNNALIYPGLALGAILSAGRFLTDRMIIAGAQRLAQLSPSSNTHDASDALLPDFGDSPTVNFEVAVAVCERAVEDGVAGKGWEEWYESEGKGKDSEGIKLKDGWKEEVRKRARARAWRPVYGEYIYDENGEC